MARKMPSLFALVGMAAVAGFRNRKKIAKFIDDRKASNKDNTSVGKVPEFAHMRRPAA
mgnify:CR=1 FL=1